MSSSMLDGTGSVSSMRSAGKFVSLYDYARKRANFASGCASSIKMLVCKWIYVREVPTCVRVVADPSEEAVVVGNLCNAG
jgi:hypothetical protein